MTKAKINQLDVFYELSSALTDFNKNDLLGAGVGRAYLNQFVQGPGIAGSILGRHFSTLAFYVVFGPQLTDVPTRDTGYTGRPALPWRVAYLHGIAVDDLRKALSQPRSLSELMLEWSRLVPIPNAGEILQWLWHFQTLSDNHAC